MVCRSRSLVGSSIMLHGNKRRIRYNSSWRASSGRSHELGGADSQNPSFLEKGATPKVGSCARELVQDTRHFRRELDSRQGPIEVPSFWLRITAVIAHSQKVGSPHEHSGQVKSPPLAPAQLASPARRTYRV